MPQEFKLGSFSDFGALSKTPQEGLQNIENDFTSVFGSFTKDYLKDIPLHHTSENIETPFSYENVMKNIFVEEYENHKAQFASYDCEEDEEEVSLLEFEC